MAWFGNPFGHSQARLGVATTDSDITKIIDKSEQHRKIMGEGIPLYTHQDKARYYAKQLREELAKSEPNKELVNYYTSKSLFHKRFKPVYVPLNLLRQRKN